MKDAYPEECQWVVDCSNDVCYECPVQARCPTPPPEKDGIMFVVVKGEIE